jgi:hypothetical protein
VCYREIDPVYKQFPQASLHEENRNKGEDYLLDTMVVIAKKVVYLGFTTEMVNHFDKKNNEPKGSYLPKKVLLIHAKEQYQ